MKTTIQDHPVNEQLVLDNPRPESRKTAMAHGKPFWTLRVHEKRDVLVARQKARQIAHLLHFPPLEEACIAAGTFAVAAQARDHYEICDLCFQLDHHQLVVFAKPLGDEPSVPSAKSLMKLAKPVPDAARGYSVDELAFLIGRINDQAPADLFGDLSKQNQEILLLLHLLNHPADQLGQKSTSAA
ncbi:MAG: hypothetical protein K8T91_07160 [Planctomycetes bacterium]|nr:hypothetical protein [Planctomycetota bacterium]